MITPQQTEKKKLHVGADKIRTLDVSEGTQADVGAAPPQKADAEAPPQKAD